MSLYMMYAGNCNFGELQEFLGKRPGDYRVDPYYVRTGQGDKPYFWEVKTKKWRGIRIGDMFYINPSDGLAVRKPK